MNIKTTSWRGERVDTVEDFVSQSLDSDNAGQLESAQETAKNATEALGRLVDLLASRKHLSAADIVFISGSYADKPELG